MAEKKLSIAEMMALARKQGAVGSGGGGDAAPAAAAPAEKPPAAEAPPAPVAEAAAEPVAEAPAAPPPPKPAAPKPAGGKMSVAEMMAAARAGGAGAKPAAAAPAPKPVEKKEAPKPAAAAAKEKPTAPVAGGPKDTSSILAALRKGPKPGPITKAEAAAKEKAEPVTAKQKPTVPPMPVKPEYAKPKAAAKAEDETRRGFVSLLMGSMLSLGYTALAATGGLWTLGFARFMFPNILTEPPSKFKVGFPGDFAPGKVEEKFKAQFGVWIVNTEYAGQQEIVAIRTVCTHLGCTPNWLEAEQKFKCPCHGSGFYKDGINFEGPAPRPLERYAISLSDDGQLEVDKGKLFFEEMGQWSDPACYYPA